MRKTSLPSVRDILLACSRHATGTNTKIEFDKRTSLGASVSFRAAVRSQRFLAGNVAKKMCAQLAQEVVSVVPRVDDYTCPICFSIAWYPVRLRCSHIFCVRCVIKMQRESKKQCPLCRDEVVMEADLCEYKIAVPSPRRSGRSSMIVGIRTNTHWQRILTRISRNSCVCTFAARQTRSRRPTRSRGDERYLVMNTSTRLVM